MASGKFRKMLSALGDKVLGGHFIQKATNLTSGTVVSSENWGNSGHLFYDSKDAQIGVVTPAFKPDGKQGLRIQTQRIINGSQVGNHMVLFIDANGNRSIELAVPAEWRSALGLGSVATESTVPISKGGTGQTTAANARNALGLGTFVKKIESKYISVSIPANSNHVSVTASIPSGGSFVSWLVPVPSGWGGALWYSSGAATAELYTTDTASYARSVSCVYLVAYAG